MKSGFLTHLDSRISDTDEKVHILLAPLAYYSEKLNATVSVPEGFQTDLSSVPRVPVVYSLWEAKFRRIGIGRDFIHADDDPNKPQGVVWLY